MLITSQKEGAITGGPDFIKAVGDTILDATVSENLPGIMLLIFTLLYCLIVLLVPEPIAVVLVMTNR